MFQFPDKMSSLYSHIQLKFDEIIQKKHVPRNPAVQITQ